MGPATPRASPGPLTGAGGDGTRPTSLPGTHLPPWAHKWEGLWPRKVPSWLYVPELLLPPSQLSLPARALPIIVLNVLK